MLPFFLSSGLAGN